MAPSSNEAILIVLDVGPSVYNEISYNGKSFLSNAQLCATKIIQRKIFSCSKDEIGLLLLGSEETNNALADEHNYNNIEISHPFQRANWEMIQTIASYKNGTPIDGDWLDALIVAADYMKAATEGKIFKEKRIVMLTNFRSNVNDDDVKYVVQGLQNENVQLIVIGPQVYATETHGSQSAGQNKSEEQEEGEKLIASIVDTIENSLICGFEDALSQLQYFEQKKCRPMPWKTIMDIGSTVKIPVSGYKKTVKIQRIKTHDIIIPSKLSSQSSKQDPSTSQEVDGSVKPNVEDNFYKNRDSIKDFCPIDKDLVYKTDVDNSTHVDVSDIIKGFMFGTTVVPVTEDDAPGLAYESGPRCLSVLGFTNKSHVPCRLFKGECYQIFPQMGEDTARAFAALVQAMNSNDVVAIARKVYNINNCPVLCALFPMITSEFQCFMCIELPFREQVNTFLFPSLVNKNNKPTSEQLKAVDHLITSMDLMGIDDEEQRYDAETTLDPYEQHYYSLIARKALSGELFISGSDIDEAVKMLLTPNEKLLEAAKPAINKIKELFHLTEVVPKEGVRKAAVDIFKQDSTPTDKAVPNPLSDTKDATLHIGTVHPNEDFMTLLSKDVPLDKACRFLGQVILDMILKAFDADDFIKPFKSLVLMRKVCLENNPSVFNDWIRQFKGDLPVEKIRFWELHVRDQAGLITISESNLSTVTAEEAKKFLQIDNGEEELSPTHSVDEDLDDLINQM